MRLDSGFAGFWRGGRVLNRCEQRSLERFGVLEASGAFRRVGDVRKRRRAGALQDAVASFDGPMMLGPTLESRATGRCGRL